jgi:hypothetical protein
MYVAQTYEASFQAVYVYTVVENVITQFFAVDFLYNLFSSPNYFHYLSDPWTVVDVLTIIPIYITQALSSGVRVNLSIFRFIRILRLVRILRAFKLLGGFSGVKRQIITLSLTLTSLVFMAAGIIQIMENDVKAQMEFKCNYINEYTNWHPSCSSAMPLELYLEAGNICDCTENNCSAFYQNNNRNGEPTGIRCTRLTFLDAFYFMVVTGLQ